LNRNEQANVKCKPTYHEPPMSTVASTSMDLCLQHHWVHRRTVEGRCRACHKSFHHKLFGERTRVGTNTLGAHKHGLVCIQEAVAIQCVWCKFAYHNKSTCFTMEASREASFAHRRIRLQVCDNECTGGSVGDVLVPPAWIVRIDGGSTGTNQQSTRRRRGSSTSLSKRGRNKSKKVCH
jgi:diacylglycerol kinase (ATP)